MPATLSLATLGRAVLVIHISRAVSTVGRIGNGGTMDAWPGLLPFVFKSSRLHLSIHFIEGSERTKK